MALSYIGGKSKIGKWIVPFYPNDMDKREEWSKIITEEFDRLQKLDKDFDYIMQLSQREMVLIGNGPLIFEDSSNCRSCCKYGSYFCKWWFNIK